MTIGPIAHTLCTFAFYKGLNASAWRPGSIFEQIACFDGFEAFLRLRRVLGGSYTFKIEKVHTPQLVEIVCFEA